MDEVTEEMALRLRLALGERYRSHPHAVRTLYRLAILVGLVDDPACLAQEHGPQVRAHHTQAACDGQCILQLDRAKVSK